MMRLVWTALITTIVLLDLGCSHNLDFTQSSKAYNFDSHSDLLKKYESNKNSLSPNWINYVEHIQDYDRLTNSKANKGIVGTFDVKFVETEYLLPSNNYNSDLVTRTVLLLDREISTSSRIVNFERTPLNQLHRMCEGELLYEECSTRQGGKHDTFTGFMIDSNYVLTTSHGNPDKSDIVVVPNLIELNETCNTLTAEIRIARYCHNLSGDSSDLSIYKLDKPIPKIEKFRNYENIKIGEPIFMLGHPQGLSMCYTYNAKSVHFDNGEVICTLDSFDGNSGSPVYNIKGKLVGIKNKGVKGIATNSSGKCSELQTYCESQTAEKFIPIYKYIDQLKDL